MTNKANLVISIIKKFLKNIISENNDIDDLDIISYYVNDNDEYVELTLYHFSYEEAEDNEDIFKHIECLLNKINVNNIYYDYDLGYGSIVMTIEI